MVDPVYTVGESSGVVSVCVQLQGEMEGMSATVQLSTQSGMDDEFDEEDGAGLVCVILSEGQLGGITATVALSTSDNTATSPSESTLNVKHTIFLLPSTADYTPLVSSELTFGPTASTGSTQCTSVSLVDDGIVEDTEQFSVEVSSTFEIVLIASPSSAVYSIADDVDCEYYCMSLFLHYQSVSLSLCYSCSDIHGSSKLHSW